MGALTARPPGQRRRWAAVTAAQVTADLLYGRWQAADTQPHRVGRAAYESVEGAVWALAGRPDPISSRLAQIGSVVPTAVEWGVRVGSGDRSLPTMAPSRPFPPERRAVAATAVDLALPVLAPHLAIRAVRRSRGWAWNRFEYVWPVMALGGGVLLGAYRQRLHQEARAEWRNRAEHQIAGEASTAQVQAAIRDSPGHQFKKALAILGAAGSAPAASLAREQLSRPASIAASVPGTTLFSVAAGIPIEPPERRDLWLGAQQWLVLDAFIEEVDTDLEAAPASGAGPVALHVVAIAGSDITITYRGRTLHLANPAPLLQVGLDPIPAVLVIAAFWKVLAWLNPHGSGAPPLPSLLIASLDLAAAVHQLRRRRQHHVTVDPAVVAASVISAAAFNAVLFVSAPPTTNASGEQIFLGTSPSAGVLAVCGTYCEQLGRWVWPLAGATVALWLLGAVGRTPRPVRAVLIESITLWQAFFATKGLAASLASEAALVEDDLQAEFADRVRAARVEAVASELARFRHQLAVAEVELDATEELDPHLRRAITEECRAMRSWLEDPWTQHALVS